MTPRDWPTFWQSLTPEECADALRSAPRVAGEWTEHGGGLTRRRVGGNGEFVAETFGNRCRVHPDDHWMGVNVKDTDEGRAFADECLRDAGWILL